MAAIRKWAGLIAALLILALGIAFLHGPGLPIGIALILAGGAAALWQIRSLITSRQDPYDLKRLFDPPPIEDTPEDEFLEADNVPYCHHCGHAVSNPFARCPECGNKVR